MQTRNGSASEANEIEVLASHIFADSLELNGVVTDEASYPAQNQEGVASVLKSGHQSLHLAGVKNVADGRGAVAQVIARDFLGDHDAHAGNYIVGPKGLIVSLDFGRSFNKGISKQRPSSFMDILGEFGSSETIAPMLDRIRSFTDQDIDAMVEDAGTHIRDWNDEKSKKFQSVLRYNRNLMTQINPYAEYM